MFDEVDKKFFYYVNKNLILLCYSFLIIVFLQTESTQ